MDNIDILNMNNEIAIKFSKLEKDIVACEGLGELFAKLVFDSAAAFDIPAVWISLLRLPETWPIVYALNNEPALKDRLNVIEQASFSELCPEGPTPLLAFADVRAFYRLMPPRLKFIIRSIAVAPINLHGYTIGSINHGDPSPERYHPGMDTTMLEQLMAVFSQRLSELLMR
ncbi:MAG: hypothetical protein K0B01_00190 [Syntrophobacterales bacterium]|nr:hypothetical protein [Syntrophobacterales bacterium]